MKTVRNGKIELLRFVFCVCIVLVHTDQFVPDGVRSIMPRASLAVEFFFLVSGYLMASSVAKKVRRGDECQNIGEETIAFVWGKIKALMPNYIFAFMLAFVVALASKNSFNFHGCVVKFMEVIWEPLFLEMAGFGTVRVNGADWYISAMLLCMLILYPVCRKHFDLFTHVIGPVIGIFVLGRIYYEFQTVTGPTKEMGLFYVGTLRALAEISLGAAMFPLVEKIAALEFTKAGQYLLSLLEFGCYAYSIRYMQIAKDKKYDFFIVFLIMVGITLSFSAKGRFADAFNKKVCYLLGKFSLSLYLSHIFWAKAIKAVYPNADFGKTVPAYLALAFVTSCLVYAASELWKKYQLGKRLCSLFIKG